MDDDSLATADAWGGSAAAVAASHHHTYPHAPFTASTSAEDEDDGEASAAAAATTSDPAHRRRSLQSHSHPRPPLRLADAAGKLAVTVSDPQKHGDGGNAFVNYLVSSKTTLPSYSGSEFAVRRRFQDFVALHRALAEEAPTCVLPPLPDKHRMEYITGDRFSSEFIERRRVSLQSYMDRVARHPSLQATRSLRLFVESSDTVR
ncbi:intercellular trafficking and secretion [Cladochytrium tenue]|nr:intercellular trafficking and secretion [Cladochytrium tenue]